MLAACCAWLAAVRSWLVDRLLCVACFSALLDSWLAALRGFLALVPGWLPCKAGWLPAAVRGRLAGCLMCVTGYSA
jgi:hypothetical protein